ncbi:MAG: hypothetical protein Q9169_000325 [Polycauliona sp. 2 TL-2023]
MRWSGVLFVRKGPYAPAILRFHLSFPPGYPDLPPLITFTTDIFHPLVTPVTTYTYGVGAPDSNTHAAGDNQRLPPGGFGLTDAFPRWFGTSERSAAQIGIEAVAQAEPSEHEGALGTNPELQSRVEHVPLRISIVHVLDYVKSSFDDSDVLNNLPSAVAVNPGAWKAWQAYRCGIDGTSSDRTRVVQDKQKSHSSKDPARHPADWNWEGVWERRVRKGVDASISDPVLFGASGVEETSFALWDVATLVEVIASCPPPAALDQAANPCGRWLPCRCVAAGLLLPQYSDATSSLSFSLPDRSKRQHQHFQSPGHCSDIHIMTMDFCRAVSTPSTKLIRSCDDHGLTPRPLQINKRKRQPSQHDSSARTNLATSGLVPAVKVRRAATMSYPPTFLKAQSPWDPNTGTKPTGPSRAVTLGTVDSLRRTGPHDFPPFEPKLSTSSIKGGTRFQSNWRSSPGSGLDHTVRRLPSFRHRMLSRVMNGLIGRSSSSQPTADTSDQRPLSIEGSSSNESAASAPDQRTSLSTTERSPSISTNFETALFEFPEPPSTMPTSLPLFAQAQPAFQAYRELRAPTDAAIVCPKILITPELDGLDSNKDQKLHVAVEVNASAETGRRTQGDRLYGLDVAVIIDNSLFASPAALMASCETTRFLSSLLDLSNDRMAIICTSSLGVDHPDLRTLMPLTCISPRRTKATVDAIVGATERPSQLALEGAVRSARALLEQSRPRAENRTLGPSVFGHIFILTSHSSGLPHDLLVHDRMQLHLVCPGSVPWNGEAKSRCNGWKLQSMHSKQLHSSRFVKDEDPWSLFNQLRTTIADARTGSLHGAVSDLVLDLEPGRHCTVENVMGQRKRASIQPGERSVALVTLKIGLAPAAGYTVRSGRRNDLSSPICHDPDKELDELLGTTPVNILTATLRYKHSLLSSETRCTLTTDCHLRRPLPLARWMDLPRKPSSPRHRPEIEIHKQFAFHIATHHEPRQAMTVLIEDFGDGGRRSACPEYIRLLIEELRYQARIIERFDLADYTSAPTVLTPCELRPDVSGQEQIGQSLFNASQQRPDAWITDAPDDAPIEFPVRQSSKSKPRDCTLSDETTDEARKIWVDLNRKSRKQFERSGGSENSVPRDMDEATRRLRDLALKHKRSVGAESLKSLALPEYRGKTMELYSPWL